jgi:hypothetical protein
MSTKSSDSGTSRKSSKSASDEAKVVSNLNSSQDTLESGPFARLCHLKKWPHFQGYGFNLHAERSKMGQHIGKVDLDSPADSAGLKEGDRIIEVNNVNISNENHQQVVKRIRNGLLRDETAGDACADQVILLVVDTKADEYYKRFNLVPRHDMENVVKFVTPDIQPIVKLASSQIEQVEHQEKEAQNEVSSKAKSPSPSPAQLNNENEGREDLDEKQKDHDQKKEEPEEEEEEPEDEEEEEKLVEDNTSNISENKQINEINPATSTSVNKLNSSMSSLSNASNKEMSNSQLSNNTSNEKQSDAQSTKSRESAIDVEQKENALPITPTSSNSKSNTPTSAAKAKSNYSNVTPSSSSSSSSRTGNNNNRLSNNSLAKNANSTSTTTTTTTTTSTSKVDPNDPYKMSAADYRNYLKSKGRSDPRMIQVDMKQKYEIFQNM